jgi:hypothetical protein
MTLDTSECRQVTLLHYYLSSSIADLSASYFTVQYAQIMQHRARLCARGWPDPVAWHQLQHLRHRSLGAGNMLRLL